MTHSPDHSPSERGMRLLFIGDVVGRAGRKAIQERLPELRRRWALDFIVVNGENAAGGFGITEAICDEILAAGADCVTTGNHVFDQREALVFIERQPRLLRPVNYPPGTPGRGANLYTAENGRQVLVVNVQGRVFMDALDDPFAAIEREVAACPLGAAATRSSSTYMPRRPARKWRWAISSTAAPRWWWARIPMCRRRTGRLPQGRPI